MDCSTPGLLPCTSPIPRAYSNSHSSSRWCHPTTLTSVVPFSSCLQSFPASRSFPTSQFLASGGKVLEFPTPASVFQINIQDWFPLDLTGLILPSVGFSRVFCNITVQNHQFFGSQLYGPTSYPYMTSGKSTALTRQTLVSKVTSLLFNMLSRLVTTFLH